MENKERRNIDFDEKGVTGTAKDIKNWGNKEQTSKNMCIHCLGTGVIKPVYLDGEYTECNFCKGTGKEQKTETFESLKVAFETKDIELNNVIKEKNLKIQELQAENHKLKSKLQTCICFKCGSKEINDNGFCIDCGCYQ